MELIKLDENIFYYKNIIENSETLMDIIEDSEYDDELSKIISKWTPWGEIEHNRGLQKTISKEKNISIESQNKIDFLIKTMDEAFEKAVFIYKKEKNINENVYRYKDYRISLYRAGGYLDAHYDHPCLDKTQKQEAGNPNIKYTMLLYMGRSPKGGEISWVKYKNDEDLRRQYAEYPVDHEKNKDIIDFFLKPESGSIVIFPSGYPYMHAAHIVLSGTKYLISEFWRKSEVDSSSEWY